MIADVSKYNGLLMRDNHKEALWLMLVCLPIVFAANYFAALAGHPTAYWMFHNVLGLVD